MSEAGVGTIAAGVAKAGAQVILISGHDGGTGAAPISSIHHAGLPWELGLAETHQTLIQNGLRSRVRIETDGKLMSGRDVIIAALLGAEEFGFATAPLIAMGCRMMRVCQKDTCPFGVATQNEKLRARFPGKPEYVENFMRFIAQEMREYMARFGIRTVDELVGRTELISVRENPAGGHAALLDVSRILAKTGDAGKMHFVQSDVYNFGLEKTLDEKVLLPVFEKGEKMGNTVPIKIHSTDRAFGTILGSEIQKRFGGKIDADTYRIVCEGGAGQSFGAFIPKGLSLYLHGDANDYFGKGLSGGKLVVRPSENFTLKAQENIIVGNVALFGATSGEAYINGIAGERFCVRNSGANAVAEGCGDHGLEYMTGGTVVILGKTGRNFAAGMSGGVAFVYDSDHTLYKKLNHELVSLEEVTEPEDKKVLRDLIERHVAETDSELGRSILDDFDNIIGDFKKVIPNDYKRILQEIALAESRGLSRDDAEMQAFKTVTQGA